MLSDDPDFNNSLFRKSSGEEFIFRNEVNQILADFFAVLNFCNFSFKRKVNRVICKLELEFIPNLIRECFSFKFTRNHIGHGFPGTCPASLLTDLSTEKS